MWPSRFSRIRLSLGTELRLPEFYFDLSSLTRMRPSPSFAVSELTGSEELLER